MSLTDAMLREMEQEAHATRRLLERLPEDKLSWKSHSKSFSLGQLALHIAQLPGFIPAMAAQDVFEAPQFHQPEAQSREETLRTLEEGLVTAKGILSAMDDVKVVEPWTLLLNGKPVMTVPRLEVLRTILLNHYYHHRGQLSVYLRLLDVPLPSIYGPSADESPFG